MANSVEMLSGRRKKDYAAESAAEALAAQAEALGIASATSGDGAPAFAADDEHALVAA